METQTGKHCVGQLLRRLERFQQGCKLVPRTRQWALFGDNLIQLTRSLFIVIIHAHKGRHVLPADYSHLAGQGRMLLSSLHIGIHEL